MDDFFDFVVIIEWVGDFGGFGRDGDFDGFGIVLIEDEVVLVGLVFGDVGFGSKVVFVILVDIKVVWFEVAEDGDVRRFCEIPKLEARHFVNYCRVRF